MSVESTGPLTVVAEELLESCEQWISSAYLDMTLDRLAVEVYI